MNNIQLRLSTKSDTSTGKSEILIRVSVRVSSKVATLRAKSGIFIFPNHFQYYIDRKSCQEYNIKVPVKLITCTKDEAEKKGYCIFDKGEVVINEKVKTPDVIEEIESSEKLRLLLNEISDAINDKMTVQTSEDLKKLIDRFHNRKIVKPETEISESLNIYDLMELYLQKKTLNTNTENGFRCVIRTLWRYESFKRAFEDDQYTLDVHTITRYDIEDFEDYIRNEYDLSLEYPSIFAEFLDHYPDNIKINKKKTSLQRRGHNYVTKMKAKLKTFFMWLYETERTQNRPFDGVKIGTQIYGTPYYINIGERNIIADYDLSDHPSLEVQRDIFIFQCLIGCRVSDLITLTKANINNGILEYIPSKTKDESSQVKPRIPLNARALALIKKYQGKDEKGRLFPFISPQKYNQAIKSIFTICGITRNVAVRNPTTGETEVRPINEIASSHMARRTFIGAAYKVVKDPNLIGKMSGHVEGSKAFVRYRDIDDDMLKDVISQI